MTKYFFIIITDLNVSIEEPEYAANANDINIPKIFYITDLDQYSILLTIPYIK